MSLDIVGRSASTEESFDNYMKNYRRIIRNQDPASRLSRPGQVQMLNALMYKDPEVRKEYKLLSIQSALGAADGTYRWKEYHGTGSVFSPRTRG